MHEQIMDNIILYQDEYILKAQGYLDELEFIKAKRLLLELLEQAPDNGQAHSLLGWIYGCQLEEFELAEKHLQTAIRYAPRLASAYYNYLSLLGSLGRYHAVIKLTRKIEGVPSVRQDWNLAYRAKAYEMLGSYSEAVSNYKRSIVQASSQKLISFCDEGLERVNRKINLEAEGGYFCGPTLV